MKKTKIAFQWATSVHFSFDASFGRLGWCWERQKAGRGKVTMNLVK